MSVVNWAPSKEDPNIIEGHILLNGERIDFKAPMAGVLSLLSEALKKSEVVWDVLFSKEGGPVMVLTAEDARLLRDDPVRVIKAFTRPELQNVVYSGPKRETSIAVGYDVLSQGFGESVFCRQKGEAIECPGCGKWRLISCKHCKLDVEFEEHGKWASVRVPDLLASNLSRFFLPRPWNGGKPWVSKEELQAKYVQFLKEKSDV